MFRKAYLFDVITYSIMIFVFAVSTLFALYILTEWNSATTDVLTEQVARDVIDKGATAIVLNDLALVILLGGLTISLLVSAYFIPSHPVMLLPSILFLVLAVLVSAQISNVYVAFGQTDLMSAAYGNLPAAAYILTYLPIIMSVIGALFILVMFGKSRGQSSEVRT